jgi:hypothetical protein
MKKRRSPIEITADRLPLLSPFNRVEHEAQRCLEALAGVLVSTSVDPGAELVTLPAVLSNSSIILAFGQAVPQRTDTTGGSQSIVSAELLSGSVIVASRRGTRASMDPLPLLCGEDGSVAPWKLSQAPDLG